MTVGVPREVKEGEHRVAITPDGVHELVAHDVTVLVETDAGADSAITDAEYAAAGAEIVADADAVSRAAACPRAPFHKPRSPDHHGA